MGVRRPELVVAAAIVLCLPSLPGLVDGGLSPVAIAVRFALALALSWGAGALIERVLDAYSRQVRQAETLRMIEEARGRAQAAGIDPWPGVPAPPPAPGRRPSDR